MKTAVYTVALSALEKEQWLESFRYFGDPETVFFMDIETTGDPLPLQHQRNEG